MGRPDCLQDTKAAFILDIVRSDVQSKGAACMDSQQQWCRVEEVGSMAERSLKIDCNYEETIR